MRRDQPARQREAAAAGEDDVERRAGGGDRVDRCGDPLHVVVAEVGRVLEIDVGVVRAVEQQLAPAVPSERVWTPSASPTSTSRIPIASTALLTGISGTSTKPVPKVPTSAPAVAHADRRPTTVPLARRSRSCSRAIVGETALRTAALGTSASSVLPSAAMSPPPRAPGPSARTIGTVSSASRPPPSSSRTTSRRRSWRSANQPPRAAPTAMPASAAPMIDVVVSSVSPT